MRLLLFFSLYLAVFFGYSQDVDSVIVVKPVLHGPTVSDSAFALMARREPLFLQPLLDNEKFIKEVSSLNPVFYDGKIRTSNEFGNMGLVFNDSLLLANINVPQDTKCSSIYFHDLSYTKNKLVGKASVFIKSERAGGCLFKTAIRIEFIVKKRGDKFVLKKLKMESNHSSEKLL